MTAVGALRWRSRDPRSIGARTRGTRRALSSAATTRRSSNAIQVDSARAYRRPCPCSRDLRYGTAPRALLDYFPGPGAAGRPGLLVYIHGGYWQELSKDQSAFLAPAWHAAGFAHAVVGYTLAPEAGLPGHRQRNAATALTWLAGVGRDTRLRCRQRRRRWQLRRRISRGGVRGGFAALPSVASYRCLASTTSHRSSARRSTTRSAWTRPARRRSIYCVPKRRFRPAVVAWGEIETVGVQAPGPRVRGAARSRRHSVHGVWRFPDGTTSTRSSNWAIAHRHSLPPRAHSLRRAARAWPTLAEEVSQFARQGHHCPDVGSVPRATRLIPAPAAVDRPHPRRPRSGAKKGVKPKRMMSGARKSPMTPRTMSACVIAYPPSACATLT